MPATVGLLWVNKTPTSTSLSHSDKEERLRLFSHAQRSSRPRKGKKACKTPLCCQVARACTFCSPPCSHPPKVPLARPSDLEKRHSVDRVLPMDPSWLPEERRSVSFFQKVTSRKILTWHRDRRFWQTIVPCLVEQHPAFRHLVTAIASTHELLSDKDASIKDAFALTQCNKATRLLLSSQSWSPALLLASCILVSAYNLLRCDLNRAQLSIMSGLKINPAGTAGAGSGEQEHAEQFKDILTRLCTQHGFKLWSPDVNFQFERTKAAGPLIIEPVWPSGPFSALEQVAAAHRTITFEAVANILRNVARGAYVDPDCALAREITRQMMLFSLHYNDFRDRVPADDTETILGLKQIRFGFYHTYLLWHTKLISPTELTFDSYPNICREMLALAEEVVAARHDGQSPVYLDGIVNGALFGLGRSAFSSDIQPRVVALLKSQAPYEFGSINWVRGTVVELITETGNRRTDIDCAGPDPMPRQHFVLAGLSCGDDKIIRVEYTLPGLDATTHACEFPVDWTPCLGHDVTASQIDEHLQGIVSAYRMYGKPHPSRCVDGCVREMLFEGETVPVHWERASPALPEEEEEEP
ncbi:hypothetical protein BDY17DRAFT_160439 [Neohortaea acidophila]|uniref:Uncharacterized protein n=1 Tax=Neohortaea acidophila TaxID=245834 RepID=A0A6A6PS23_9PEZI|nr:uncharacterized protein BDY17DRAFT_160439 [Neohortaea acidophila]KAF2482464.1 hypothetical protein BDY17DRAFT_160439 [Neohortaea acidophila]